MKKIILVGCIAFGLGLLTDKFILSYDISVIKPAQADVAGMGYRDLRRDRDFKKAVRYIVESCSVNGNSISC
jgi:hypothetical protein